VYECTAISTNTYMYVHIVVVAQLLAVGIAIYIAL